MTKPRPASRVPASGAGIPRVPPTIDLRLDGDQGRVPTGGEVVAANVREIGHECDALVQHLRGLGREPLPSAGDCVFVPGGDPEWLRCALAGLGIAVRVLAGGVRITLPAEPVAFARLLAALTAALAPGALLLDLDGVLADLPLRRAIANVDDVAALAARLPIGVVTSCPQRLAASVLARHGFAPHVRTVIAAEDGPAKPSPAPVLLALQRLGVRSAWMLGDNPSDVQAARGGGVVPLAVTPHGIGAEAHAARLVEAGVARLLDGVGALRQLVRQQLDQ